MYISLNQLFKLHQGHFWSLCYCNRAVQTKHSKISSRELRFDSTYIKRRDMSALESGAYRRRKICIRTGTVATAVRRITKWPPFKCYNIVFYTFKKTLKKSYISGKSSSSGKKFQFWNKLYFWNCCGVLCCIM